MGLIYLILSVFLRLSPAVRKYSSVASSDNIRRPDMLELEFWFPLVGWVSVSVQHCRSAKWLSWRVRKVNKFYFSGWLDSRQKLSWKIDLMRHKGALRPHESPYSLGDFRRKFDQ